MITKRVDAIILNIYEQKNDSALIKVLTNESNILYFISKGFYKINSKNKNQLLIGSLSSIEYSLNYGTNNKYLLIRANLIKSFDFLKSMNSIFIERLIFVLQKIENPSVGIFNIYCKYLLFGNLEYKLWFVTFLFFQILVINHKKLELNYCIKCKKNKNLYAFSLNDGGIICFDHYKIYDTSSKDINTIKSLYYLSFDLNLYIKNTNATTNKKIYLLLKEFDENY